MLAVAAATATASRVAGGLIVTVPPGWEDAARACLEEIDAGASLVPGGDSIPVVAVTDTVLRVRGGVVAGVEPRDELALAQTPQAFRTEVLREAHAKAAASGVAFTDDASILEWAGFEVRTVPGDPGNVKITTLADLAEADRRMGGGGA